MARYCEICHLLSIANYAIIEAVRLCSLCRLPRHITFPPPFPKREASMTAGRLPRLQPRQTAAARKQQNLDFLGNDLPRGGGKKRTAGQQPRILQLLSTESDVSCWKTQRL